MKTIARKIATPVHVICKNHIYCPSAPFTEWTGSFINIYSAYLICYNNVQCKIDCGIHYQYDTVGRQLHHVTEKIDWRWCKRKPCHIVYICMSVYVLIIYMVYVILTYPHNWNFNPEPAHTTRFKAKRRKCACNYVWFLGMYWNFCKRDMRTSITQYATRAGVLV